MSQHVQLQEVILHAVIFKVGGHRLAAHIVCGVLHGGEVLNIHILRHHHKAAGMLTCGAAHALAAVGKAQDFCVGALLAPLFQVLADIAEGGFLLQRTNRTCAEHLCLAEHLNGVTVGAALILAGEVEVNIGHLTAAVAEEGLKGDVEAVFIQLRTALGAVLVGHICAAAVLRIFGELRVLTFGAVIVGRQGVDLRDAGHVGHQRRAHRASGAHQVAVFQAALHQLLSGHIHHIVLAQNALQLCIQAIHNELGRVFTVHAVALVPHAVIELLLGVLQTGRKQLTGRQQFNLLHHVGDGSGVFHHHLVGLLLAQVGELL